MTNSLERSDAECAAVAKAPRVTLDDIKASIVAQYEFRANEAIAALGMPDDPNAGSPTSLLSICILVLGNGFTIIGKSACASPQNFNRDLGRKLAYEDAIRQIWPLMGFALKERLAREG